MGNLMMRGCAFLLGVVGLVACGAADSGDGESEVGAVQQALDSQVFSSPNYPAKGVSFDAITTSLNNTYGDWYRFNIISPRWFQSYGSAGQNAGFYGMNCDYSDFAKRDLLRGISVGATTTAIRGTASVSLAA